MDHDTLNEILSCPSLPSLPAVALRVIDLTADVNVSLDELASTIQNDQALAAKVLRTVNSSYYGLRTRASTIQKAIVMLGLSPVKSLALGFSLVESVGTDDKPFPFTTYWRRGLYAAVGGRAFAAHVKLEQPDEAFLAGLLHDIGMVACFKALGNRYVEVLEAAGTDHSKLVRCELEMLELQHPEIGAMLAQRWRLPDSLVIPIRYHERPSAAPPQHGDTARVLGLGMITNEVLSSDEPAPHLRKLYTRAAEWFKISSSDVDELVKQIGTDAAELSRLFQLDTGTHEAPEGVLAAAEQRIIELQQEEPRASIAGEQISDVLAGDENTDPITGLTGRGGFENALTLIAQEHAERNEPVTVAQIAIEGLEQIQIDRGAIEADEVAIATAAMLNRHFEPLGGQACRLYDALFAVILPGCELAEVSGAAGDFVQSMATYAAKDAPTVSTTRFRTAVGLSTAVTDDPRLLIAGSARAANAARVAGADCVRIFRPRAAA